MSDVEEVVEVPDKGNPNVFKTYKGLYKVPLLSNCTTTTNKDYTVVGLTCTNELHFMDNINLNGDYLFDLSEIFDNEGFYYSAVAPARAAGGVTVLIRLIMNDSGIVEWHRDSYSEDNYIVPLILLLNGVAMNISGAFYRDVL